MDTKNEEECLEEKVVPIIQEADTVSKSSVDLMEEEVLLDDSLISSATNSPTQTPVHSNPEQSPVEPLESDDAHYDQHQVMYTQDTPRRSLRFIGNTTNWATYDALGEK